jgi:hypothetical protein
MFNTTFGHGTLRKYVIYFGTLFNNIWLKRYDNTGTLIQTMKVPLNYGPREKFLARLDGNPDLQRSIATQLPRMTFEMTGMYYDPSRKFNAINKTTAPVPGQPGRTRYQYQPVPYNIDFTLSIMVKNIEDGTYIIEQILPYFNPVWTATLNLNPDLNQKHDIPITLDNITCEDTYEGDFINRRAVIWTLSFTMKGYFFGPTNQANGTIIKEIDINLRTPGNSISIENANSTNTNYIMNIDIKPGQDANGNPLTYYNDTRLRTYNIANSTGIFTPTEKVYVNGNNYLYVASSNSSVITAYNVTGNVSNGSTITGINNRYTARITGVSVTPANAANNLTIASNTEFGFIYDITENF